LWRFGAARRREIQLVEEALTQPDTYWTSYLREMEEISTFVKDAIYNDQCLGRCLYIHGLPGTGKVFVHIFLADFTFFILSG
jgi:hypothetical protein